MTWICDPDVERLFEGCAFLTASLRQKIDDGFPEVTQCLLFRVWPLPLCLIPSTSIVQLIDSKVWLVTWANLIIEYHGIFKKEERLCH